MGYKHLTEKDRLCIWTMRRERKSQAEIARTLGCHRSTISRELKRNINLSGYDVHHAQQQSEKRRQSHHAAEHEEHLQLAIMLTDMGWTIEKVKTFFMDHYPELGHSVDDIIKITLKTQSCPM